MNQTDLADYPHRRYNILTGEWMLVSPHRAKRPWQGQEEDQVQERPPQYVKDCYLCPGNERAGGKHNPEYTGTFVFENDFAALKPETPEGDFDEEGLLKARLESGTCRVICFSPRHDLTLPDMELNAIKSVVDLWQEQFRELGDDQAINNVQIFENKGRIMGCSNPHPHGQIWSQSSIPMEIRKKTANMVSHYQKTNASLLGDYVDLELRKKDRIILQNNHFVALVPFWALWPFEAMIIAKRHFPDISEMNEEEKHAYADIIKRLTGKFDHVFNVSFPYSAGLHQAPTDGKPHPEWHFHMPFYPPLLRSATIKKFMVGYEMLGEPQRDITPELSAARLRELPDKKSY